MFNPEMGFWRGLYSSYIFGMYFQGLAPCVFKKLTPHFSSPLGRLVSQASIYLYLL